MSTKALWVPLAAGLLFDNQVCFFRLCRVDQVLDNLEETVTKTLSQEEDITPLSEDSLALNVLPRSSTTMTEVEMERALQFLFDNVCGWQEHSILGTLTSGLANQMAGRLVLLLGVSFYQGGHILV